MVKLVSVVLPLFSTSHNTRNLLCIYISQDPTQYLSSYFSYLYVLTSLFLIPINLLYSVFNVQQPDIINLKLTKIDLL